MCFERKFVVSQDQYQKYNENCISLSKEKHLWLDHDSFMRCGGELISNMSEDVLMEKLGKQICSERQGILGSINAVSRSAICAATERSDKLTSFQKERIAKELDSWILIHVTLFIRASPLMVMGRIGKRYTRHAPANHRLPEPEHFQSHRLSGRY